MSGWEPVDHRSEKMGSLAAGEETKRMEVPGGWIYKVVVWTMIGGLDSSHNSTVSLVFVPFSPTGDERL